ncbi:MAG: nitrite/sulfite reductase [Candidatus Glassbacteria bacterium]
MQRDLKNVRRSEEEMIKAAGLVIDFDEIARKGVMTKEEVALAKAYGVYSSRQKSDHMIRVTNPGGVMTSAQVRALVRIAEKYAQGKCAYTTRQSVQLHKVKLTDIPHLLRELAAGGLTSWHGCGDNLRNVAACPWASGCPHRRLDVYPYAVVTQKTLNSYHDTDNLPRKFKITYSGCGGNCGQPHINCIGAVAIERLRDGKKEIGFRVFIGGGMGWKPFQGSLLYSFVPPDRIVALCRAIALLFRDYGDRFNRAKARLKFVVYQLGLDRCRELVEGFMAQEGTDYRDFETRPVEDCGPQIPGRPLAVPNPLDCEGLAIVRIMVPKGELTGQALARVAELSEMYGDKKVHSTNRQNLEIHGVAPEKAAELKMEIEKIGFGTENFFGLDDIVPCVGVTYCPLAVSTTRNLYDLLIPVVSRSKYDRIRDKAIINITGCPNSCSPYRIADIGFRGMRIRELRGSSEAYQVVLGGTEDCFGQLFGEYKEADCVRATESILDTFLSLQEGAETLAENVRRLGVEPYQEVWQNA